MLHSTHFICRRTLILIVLSGLICASIVQATPYQTPQEISEEFARSGAASEPQFTLPLDRGGRNALDDIAYFAHYRLLCDFLVSLQYAGSGNNHGGMIEGESGSDHSIIETDNTQEAIRTWSLYALWTGDTATYGPNIRLAKGYCERYPAWREGGEYYAIHNCGWGFEAERIYRQAYNDTTWTWYADSCALWVVAHPLNYDPHSTDLGQLNPCAEGLGIGGMYPHALYRQRQDWINFALNEGRRLRTWFESNPARLNANETWALCGGTALWGVCVSLFAAYPDSGETWINQYGPQLDVWQSTGQWNHSFNAWYCNAQHLCFQLTQDSMYWENAVYITDSLIGLDTDNDGGIPPGRGYPVTNDHSWVSAYMGWMGMSRIIEAMPFSDAVAEGFTSPRDDVPYLAGDSLIVSARILNAGVEPVMAWVFVNGQAYADSAEYAMSAGVDTVVTLSRRWVLPDDNTLPLLSPLHLRISIANDEDPTNDTTAVNFDVRRSAYVQGMITSPNGGTPFPVRVEFYHEGYPDSAWTFIEQSSESLYTNGSRALMAGVNTIHVIPPIQMILTGETVDIAPGPTPQEVDIEVPLTEVALLDDDAGDQFETYYISSLDCLDVRARWWDKAALGLPDISMLPTLIWYTGNDSTTTLEDDEQSVLADYLNQGGHLFLTGQNITDDLGPNSIFLSSVLHCSSRTPDTDERRVYGFNGDSISNGMDIYLIGSQGAQNQTSPASIYALAGSREIFFYSGSDSEVCGVSGTYGEGRFVFLSFGLEGVSGIGGSTTRHEILRRTFAWFGDSISAVDDRTIGTPLTIELAQNFPNPFNPLTTINFIVPPASGRTRLSIFNLLGQEVRTLYDGLPSGRPITVQWNGTNETGESVASGIYVYRLNTRSETISKTLQLVR